MTQDTVLGRVEAITKTRGLPRGNAPRRPHLINRIPGAQLHGPKPPKYRAGSGAKTLLNTKTLKLLAADSAKPEEGTLDAGQKKSMPRTQQERRKPSFLNLEKGVMEELTVRSLRTKAVHSDGEARKGDGSREEPLGSQKKTGTLWKSEESPRALARRTKRESPDLSKQARRRNLRLRANYLLKAGEPNSDGKEGGRSRLKNEPLGRRL